MGKEKGKLNVVGIGPGHHDHMTFRAKQAIQDSEVIIGYDTYVSLIEDIIDGKENPIFCSIVVADGKSSTTRYVITGPFHELLC